MQRSESIAQLVAAMAKAQASMKNPSFDRVNPHFKSKYTSLAAVRDAVLPALAKEGLALMQFICTAEDMVVCTTLLSHESGEYIQDDLRLPATATAQGYTAAATYAKRIAMTAICGVAGDDDDDGESTPRDPRPERQAALTRSAEEQAWMDAMQGLLEAHGRTEEEITKTWRWVAHRCQMGWSPALGRKLYGELEVRLQPPKTPAQAAKAEPPAGEAGFTFIAQIEALLHARGEDLATAWEAAEAWRGKLRAQFSVADYVALLKHLREQEAPAPAQDPETAEMFA